MHLNYDKQRFAEALREGLELGVDVLLVPEMALPEGERSEFDTEMANIICSEQENFYDRTGKIPSLSLIVSGVLGGATIDGFHRNFAVMFDRDGNRAAGFEQLKLSHWNLTKIEQERFGIDRYHANELPLADPIIENCLPADIFTILEIPGLGRTGILICADMSQDNPGDWLSLNAMLDIIFAPIMDKSICWKVSDKIQHKRSWIVRRSLRFAWLSQAKVISTNSVSLTKWVNETNRIIPGSFPQLEEAGVGLALNGREDPPTYSHALVDVENPARVSVFANKIEDWPPFPAEAV